MPLGRPSSVSRDQIREARGVSKDLAMLYGLKPVTVSFEVFMVKLENQARWRWEPADGRCSGDRETAAPPPPPAPTAWLQPRT